MAVVMLSNCRKSSFPGFLCLLSMSEDTKTTGLTEFLDLSIDIFAIVKDGKSYLVLEPFRCSWVENIQGQYQLLTWSSRAEDNEVTRFLRP